MNINRNKKYLTISFYAVGVLVTSGIILLLSSNIDNLFSKLAFFGNIMSPVIFAIIFAYLLDPVVVFFTKKIIQLRKNQDVTPKQEVKIHSSAVFLTAAATLVVVGIFAYFVLPQLLAGLTSIISTINEPGISNYFSGIKTFLAKRTGETSRFYISASNFLTNAETATLEYYRDFYEKTDFSSVIGQLTTETGQKMFLKIWGGILGTVSGFFNFIIAFIIAVNMLMSKNTLLKQCKKIIFAFLKKDNAEKTLKECTRANHIFRKYATGVLLDAALMAVLTFVGCAVMNIRYSLLIGVLIGVTNVIPFFGPFIGGIPAALLILASDPLKALYFVIFMLILQQIDGNFFVPLIQGDATGLPAVWVLAAVIIGGGLFGFAGLLFAVPACAVLYLLFKDFTEAKLKKKGLPTETLDY